MGAISSQHTYLTPIILIAGPGPRLFIYQILMWGSRTGLTSPVVYRVCCIHALFFLILQPGVGTSNLSPFSWLKCHVTCRVTSMTPVIKICVGGEPIDIITNSMEMSFVFSTKISTKISSTESYEGRVRSLFPQLLLTVGITMWYPWPNSPRCSRQQSQWPECSLQGRRRPTRL